MDLHCPNCDFDLSDFVHENGISEYGGEYRCVNCRQRLSNEYDAINGGFVTQELVMLGGRRGSGKSIIALNCAMKRFSEGNTVAFLSIEMRYKEIYRRLLSMISGVSFLNIFKNTLTDDERLKIYIAKLDTFYKSTDYLYSIKKDLIENRNFRKIEKQIKENKPELKENRYFIIDKADLKLSKIDNYYN